MQKPVYITPEICETVPMNDGTYHRDLGLPGELAPRWAGHFRLVYSEHAKHAALTDRLGRIPIFDDGEFEAQDVVEVSVRDGEPYKAVLRCPCSDYLDLIFVLENPSQGACVVRTVWFNLASDTHKTLDRSKYQRP